MNKKEDKPIKMQLVSCLVCLYFVFILILNLATAEVPSAPTQVYIEGNRLMVKKPSMVAFEPYLIKGVSWQPSTQAPDEGQNPLNNTELIPYGFFFDWYNRNPVGSEVLNYWLKNQVLQHYQSDIPLMKDMNVNTVRVYNDFYNDFDNNPGAYRQVLDEFYRNGIMVIMTVAISRDDFEGRRFYVYSDQNSFINHYAPSGWIGDIGDLSFADDVTNPAPHSGQHCLRITYSASGPQHWAGIYWQYPENNWGSLPGHDVKRFVRLEFWAKGQYGGEKISEVKIGGIPSDTATVSFPDTPIILTDSWQKYSIDLHGYDLSNIRGGFYISFKQADINSPQTIYLDDICYVSEEKRYEQVVNLFKDHPAILMWSIGNEWNINNFYGYNSLSQAAYAVNQAALDIKTIDPFHPVSSCLGDIFTEPNCDPADPCCNLNMWTVTNCVNNCPAIDVWGINVYRGASFGEFFNQWAQTTTKPFYLSEFGIDSFNTNSFTPSGCYFATNCSGWQDQPIQASYVLNLWSEISSNLSCYFPEKLCLGGLVHEFNDELWKVGNYHVGLGGLVEPADTSYDEYNTQGITSQGNPDGVANEEYFGIFEADRTPKVIFNYLKQYYATLIPIPPSSLEAKVILAPSPQLHYVVLNWADNSENEDGFKIERKMGLDSGPEAYRQIATVGPNVRTYIDQDNNADNDLIPNVNYVYRVRAYKGDINSDYSNSASITFCFIATAVYGTSMADQIQPLVNFRDKYLMKNSIGRKIVDLYYKISPPLANYISANPSLKSLTRLFLKPIIWFCRKLTK